MVAAVASVASVAPRLRIVGVDLLVRGFPFVRRVRRVLVHDLVASYGRIVHSWDRPCRGSVPCPLDLAGTYNRPCRGSVPCPLDLAGTYYNCTTCTVHVLRAQCGTCTILVDPDDGDGAASQRLY